MANKTFKALLEKAFEPLRAFAERIDAQIEQKQLAPALATGPAPQRPGRANTSTLSLTGPAPAPAASTATLVGKVEKARQALPAPAPAQRAARPAPLQPPVATVLLEGPDGGFHRLPASTRFTAQVSTQAPDCAPVVARLGLSLDIAADGVVRLRDEQQRGWASGKVVAVEHDGRALTLTVSFNLEGQVGQGTLFVGFQAGRLTYFSGSGTGRDEAGRTVVRDLTAVAGKPAARPAPPAAQTRLIGRQSRSAKAGTGR